MKITKKTALVVLLLVGLVVGVAYFTMRYFSYYPSTEDAYIQVDSGQIAAQVAGTVKEIYVKNHEVVAKGQILLRIDPAPYEIAVDQAEATVLAAEANLRLAKEDSKRVLVLMKQGKVSTAAGDKAQSQLDQARAQLAGYKAQLAQAKLNLSHTQVFAPFNGILTRFNLQPGGYVTPNSVLCMLVKENSFWVDANFKETQLERIRTGQKAKIVFDMYPGKVFRGTVEAVSYASGSVFSLLPPENASGNWVKVTQRFPVKISIDNPSKDFPLRAGATATTTIDTKKIVS